MLRLCMHVAIVAAVLMTASAYGQDQAPVPSAFALQQSTVQDQLRALPVAAGHLFAAPPAKDAQSGTLETQKSVTPGVSRARTAALDSTYLRRLTGAKRLEVTASGRVVGEPDGFSLNLFEDAAPTIVALDSSIDQLGHRVVRGTVVGGGSAILVIDNGTVTAQITTTGGTFTVTPAADGMHRIVEVDESTERRRTDDGIRPPRDDVPLAPSKPTPERGSAVEKGSAARNLKVLVVYPPGVLTTVPTFKASLSLYLAYLNTTFQNSQIDAAAQIVGIEQTTYVEPAGADLEVLLSAIRNSTGDFARIQQIRAAVGADVVAYFTPVIDPTACGLAYLNDDLDTVTNLASATKFGASVSSVACTDVAGIFAHEVGHNMGASHDRYVVTDAVPGPAGYGYGYVDTTKKFRDVMAYTDKCTAAGITCPEIPYYSNPNLTYNGAAIGVADNLPEAADVTRRVKEILPYLVQFHSSLTAPSTPFLSVLVSGTGTVTSSPSGISCGGTCSKSFASSESVTLTAAPAAGWAFSAWSGACSGSGTCTVTVSSSKNVTATFVPAVTFGPVFAGGKSSSQSFIRVVNTGSTAGTVSIALADYSTGNALTTWTSTSIAAGAAPQFDIREIELAIPVANKPLYYTARVQPGSVVGYTQHVLWKPSDGTLTNLSTCDANITANRDIVANVHSSLVADQGYPSSIAITNTDSSSAKAVLGIYNSLDNAKLGTYTSATIPAKGQVVLPVSTIETGGSVTPNANRNHYTLRIENGFTGFLQHLVNNQQAAVITDMSTVCALDTVASPSPTVSVLQSGPIYSTAQSASQSFLRFVNTGTTAGTVAVTLRDYATGAKLGQWVSPSIPAGAAPQYAIATAESSFSGTKPQYYAAEVETTITGLFAHVLWKPSQGTLTNLSTCAAGVDASPTIVFDVHSSLVGAQGYPSTIVVNNTGATATPVTLGVYHAREATKLGTYVTDPVPAHGQLFLLVDTMELGAHITPTAAVDHYVVKVESTFTGFLQHLVNNQQAAVLTDMTTICHLPATSVTYADCRPNSGTTCTATIGTAVAGQLKEADSYSNYRVSLTGGRAYNIEVKGASTNNGTLTKPYLFILASGGGEVAQGGGGGTGNDVKLSFTPSSTGTYTVQVSSYVYADNAGSFMLLVQ